MAGGPAPARYRAIVSTVPAAGGAPVDGVPPLLHRIVDDAALVAGGARRAMDEVVDAHLAARAELGELLGSLVVPVSRLPELVPVLARRRPPAPLSITLSVDTGLGGVPKAFSLTSSRAALITPSTVEMPAPHDVDPLWLERVTEFVPEDVVAVVEPRRPDAGASPDWMEGLRRVLDHGCRPKLRCGGARAGAFPDVADVGRFLTLVVGAGRSFTVSMGLQSATRHVDDATGFVHHGWLNLLVAVARAVDGPRPGTDARTSETVSGADAGTDPAVADALSTSDSAALAREVADLDAAAVTRVRGLFSSIGSTGPGEQGAEMVRLGLATF